MSIAVNLATAFVKDARRYSIVEHRSVSKQIEYWAAMGKIAEQNPNLTFNDIKEILLGLEDMHSGNTEVYNPKKLGL